MQNIQQNSLVTVSMLFLIFAEIFSKVTKVTKSNKILKVTKIYSPSLESNKFHIVVLVYCESTWRYEPNDKIHVFGKRVFKFHVDADPSG